MNPLLVISLTLQLIGSTALIASGSPNDVNQVLEQLKKQNPDWLSPEQLSKKLVGHPQPESAKLEELKLMFNEARKREAHFDSHGAYKMRKQLFEAIERSPELNLELVEIAAQAGHDQVAAFVAEGKKEVAKHRARVIMTHFTASPIDLRRHPPPVVELLENAQRANTNPRGKLTITSDRPGVLYADGRLLGSIAKTKSVALPMGAWRIWLETPDRTSQVQRVILGNKPVAIELDSTVRNALRLEPTLHLACEIPCPKIASQIAQQLGIDTLVTVRAVSKPPNRVYALRHHTQNSGEPTIMYIDDQGLPAAPPESLTTVVARAPTSSTRAPKEFDPWWLVPFGAGQLSQDRPVAAVSYLAIQAGLAGWNIWANQRYETSLARDVSELSVSDQLTHQDELKSQHSQAMNSLIGFWTAVGLGVAEALIVGLVESSPPTDSSPSEAP
jgi:hypothetical protein